VPGLVGISRPELDGGLQVLECGFAIPLERIGGGQGKSDVLPLGLHLVSFAQMLGCRIEVAGVQLRYA